MSQIFIPMLSYEDGIAALEWLAAVFGCTEKERWLADDGTLSHGELELDGQRLMLATPSASYQSPNTIRANYAPAAEAAKLPYVMDGVLIYVCSVEAVLERAKAKGGMILSDIMTGHPGTRFRLEDPEGHRWYVFERPLDDNR